MRALSLSLSPSSKGIKSARDLWLCSPQAVAIGSTLREVCNPDVVDENEPVFLQPDQQLTTVSQVRLANVTLDFFNYVRSAFSQ